MTSTAVAKLTSSVTKARHVHFIGIGGIGLSAIARLLLAEGKAVSGSDRARSLITDELARLGAAVTIGEPAELPPEVDLVIYTIAIAADNSELMAAKRRGIETVSYPEMLGRISRDKFTIAIAGTHGKTTTTAMVAKIMVEAGLDPTVVVGSLLSQTHSNLIVGRSQYLVVEACEYRRSFLNLWPQILVITNIDADHLDYYRDLDDIKSAFAELAARVPAGGLITAAEYNRIALPIALGVPGAHNQRNAQAALAVAKLLKIDETRARRALADFRGTWRRFEPKGQLPNGALLYDDYAHHPTEIAATLQGARERYPQHQIIVIFQPHLYSRTREHLAEFAQVLATADQVLIAPIYAAREAPDPSVSSELLAERINQAGGRATGYPDFAAIKNDLHSTLPPSSSTLIITMGAGDISELPAALLQSGHDQQGDEKLE